MSELHHSDDVDALKAALVGRSIVGLQWAAPGQPINEGLNEYPSESIEGIITLDDGSTLLLAGNTGGCSCGGGDYDLDRLSVPKMNAIMDVQVHAESDPDYGDTNGYTIFVLGFHGERSELAHFDGNDGSGYYGTGFWFRVVR